MKKLIKLSLIKSVGIAITELGKLQCKLLSAKTAESPKPSVVNSDEYFTSNHQLALYLHRGDSTVKRYRYLGFIPFIRDGGRILIKKSDVYEAAKLYPNLIASSPVPPRSVPSIFTRIVEGDEEYTFIHVCYQGEKFWIPVDPEKAKIRNTVHSLCRKIIQLMHQIKPFKIAPDTIKIAA
jgi:hypothetical protein